MRDAARKTAPRWTALAASEAARALIAVLSERPDIIHGVGLFYHVLTDPAVGALWEASLRADARPPEVKLALRIFDYWRGTLRGPTGQWLRLSNVMYTVARAR